MKCVINRTSLLPQGYLWPFHGNDERVFPIALDALFAVQAIKLTQGGLWYYVEDDDFKFSGYPMWYPARCFAVIDSHIPASWVISDVTDDAVATWENWEAGFREWVEGPYFYAALVDGEEWAVACYQQNRQKL